MKRIILVFSILVSILIFQSNHTAFTTIQEMRNHYLDLQELTSFDRVDIPLTVNKEEDLQALYNFIQTYAYDDYVFLSYYKDNKIVHTSKDDNLSSFFVLKQQETKKNCISTRVDCNQRILVSKSLNPQEQPIISIIDLHSFINEVAIHDTLYVVVYTKDARRVKTMFEGFKSFHHLEKDQIVINREPPYGDTLYTNRNLLGFVSLLLFTLLLYVYFMKERKRISVYYLHGYSKLRILRYLLAPILLQSLVLCFFVQIICIFIFEQFEVTYLLSYFKTFPLFLLILFLIFIIEVLFFSMILQFSSFSKNLKINSNKIGFYSIKIIKVLSVVTLLPLVNATLANVQYTYSYLTQINYYSELEDYYFYESINWNHQDGFYEIALSSFYYVNEHQGFYHLNSLMETNEGISSAYALINHNYAAYLFDVQLDPTKEYLLYTQDTLESVLTSLNRKDMILYEVPSYQLPMIISYGQPFENFRNIPLLVVTTLDTDYSTPRFPEYMLPVSDLDLHQQDLSSLDAYKGRELIYGKDLIQAQKDYVTLLFVSLLTYIFVLSSLLSLLSYSTIYHIFDEHSKLYTVQALHGYSFRRMYQSIFTTLLIESILLYSILLLLKQPFFFSLISILLLVILECFFIWLFILRFQKKSIVAITKGDQLC